MIHARRSPGPARYDSRRIGLLGGSFNPAHDGHRHVSEQALRRLRLDQVWWLVSPQNPLKGRAETAPYEERLAAARTVADDPRLRVCDFERRHGLRYTVETLVRLRRAVDARFVWLIGADNLVQLARWHRWRQIVESAPFAVFDRAPHTHIAVACRAAMCYGFARRDESEAAALADMAPPAWVYLRVPRHPQSSTSIRAARRRADTAAT